MVQFQPNSGSQMELPRVTGSPNILCIFAFPKKHSKSGDYCDMYYMNLAA